MIIIYIRNTNLFVVFHDCQNNQGLGKLDSLRQQERWLITLTLTSSRSLK